MDARSDLQRLLEDMDKMIKRKHQELSELDDRLEAARISLSEKEAQVLTKSDLSAHPSRRDSEIDDGDSKQRQQQQDIEDYIKEQRMYFEQQIAAMNEEMAELETTNQELIKLNGQFKFEIDSARVSNEKLKARLHVLNENLEEVQSANFELNIRLAKAESESQMQQKLLKKSHDQDQVLMNAFNNKLKSLKDAIAQRDEEIKRLRLENRLTLESLGLGNDMSDDPRQADSSCAQQAKRGDSEDGASIDVSLINSSNKRMIIQVANLIKDKDAQIELLKNQLIQTTADLESNTHLLKAVASEREMVDSDGRKNKSNYFAPGEKELNSSETLTVRCKMLEDELESKDRQLHQIEWRNRYYESILPHEIIDLLVGINSALNSAKDDTESLPRINTGDNSKALIGQLVERLENVPVRINETKNLLDLIEQLQKILDGKDRHIRRLVVELNKLSAQINQDHIEIPEKNESDEDYKTYSEENKPSATILIDRRVPLMNDFETTEQSSQQPQQQLNSSRDEETVKLVDQVSHQEQQADKGYDLDKADCGPSSLAKHQPSRESTPVDTDNSARKTLSASCTQESKTNRSVNSASGSFLLRDGDTKSESDSIRMQTAHKRRPFSASSSLARFKMISLKGMQLHAHRKRNKRSECRIHRSHALEHSLNPRLKQLENENQLLELAMKEILLSIKWSDTRCNTILIDCPSLERLCQLIEARSIAACQPAKDYSGNSERGIDRTGSKQPSCDESSIHQRVNSHDLFQLILMKSELDLVRGQNELLRADLKLQRREYLERLQLSKPIDIETNQTFEESIGERGLNKIENSEAVQMESKILRNSSDSMTFNQSEDGAIQTMNNEARNASTDKCRKCSRLVKLANHLLDCIGQIESRVNNSDETYIDRLLTLYQMIQRLSQDLTIRDNLISRHQREIYSLTQQKTIIESRLHLIENQLDVHSKVCPLSVIYQQKQFVPSGPSARLTSIKYHKTTPNEVQRIDSPTRGHQNSQRGSVQRFLMRDGNLKDRIQNKTVEIISNESSKNNNITIALLQSIITCLQARLDYKDERLNQLEQLLASE